jgi:hypothetical protein
VLAAACLNGRTDLLEWLSALARPAAPPPLGERAAAAERAAGAGGPGAPRELRLFRWLEEAGGAREWREDAGAGVCGGAGGLAGSVRLLLSGFPHWGPCVLSDLLAASKPTPQGAAGADAWQPWVSGAASLGGRGGRPTLHCVRPGRRSGVLQHARRPASAARRCARVRRARVCPPPNRTPASPRCARARPRVLSTPPLRPGPAPPRPRPRKAWPAWIAPTLTWLAREERLPPGAAQRPCRAARRALLAGGDGRADTWAAAVHWMLRAAPSEADGDAGHWF